MFQDSMTTIQDSATTVLPTSDPEHTVKDSVLLLYETSLESLTTIQDSLKTVIDSLQNTPHMLEHLNNLSKYLNITADQVHGYFYTQALVNDGIYGIILGVVCIIFTFVLFYMLIVKYNAYFRGRPGGEIEVLDQTLLIALGIATVMCIISAIVNLLSGISHTLNPEYFAIVDLVEFFHPR